MAMDHGESQPEAVGLRRHEWLEQAIANLIDEQDWLDAFDPLQKYIRALPKEVKNALHGVWLKHPLHPALIAVPVGAWTVAAVG